MKVNKLINYVLVGLITLLCFYISIEIVVALKNEMPVSLFSYSVSYVPTDSMEGEILVGDYVLFKVLGYGHGVGLSQTGSDALAKNGMKAEEIIKHFYKNIEIHE